MTRVTVDAAAAPALAAARRAYAHAVNPLVVAPPDAVDTSTYLSTLLGFPAKLWEAQASTGQMLHRHRQTRHGTVAMIQAGVIVANIVLAVRGMFIWHMIERVGVVSWINRIRPHAEVTITTARLLNQGTAPFRRAVRLILPGGG